MTTPTDAPELLTPDDVAARLKLHPDTVRRLLRSGKIPGVKINARSWRVPTDKLAKWVEEQGGAASKDGDSAKAN
jgi:excisionase family DNA binding protein